MPAIKQEIFEEKRLKMLLGYAYSFLKNKEDAEDVVQDVLLKMMDRQFMLTFVRNVDAFLMRSVRNACIDLLRLRKPQSSDFRGMEADSHPEDWGDRDMLLSAMDSLSEKQRTVFYLKDVAGYSTKEIAELYSVSDTQIRVTLSRARWVLREQINKMQNYGV